MAVWAIRDVPKCDVADTYLFGDALIFLVLK